MTASDDKERLAEDISYTTEAINQILVKASCPNKFRLYIDCLVGVANGKTEFDASDSTIAKRARGTMGGAKQHANKEWAQDKRQDLLKWQNEGNLILFEHEVMPFDKSLKARPPSKFTLHLLGYAEQVISEAKQSTHWMRDSSRAIEIAAQSMVNEVIGQQVNTPKKQYIDPPTEVKTKIKTATTHLEEALRMLKKYDFSLIRDDEQLVAEVEMLTKAIRDRGFIDDVLDTIIFHGIEREPKPKP